MCCEGEGRCVVKVRGNGVLSGVKVRAVRQWHWLGACLCC